MVKPAKEKQQRTSLGHYRRLRSIKRPAAAAAVDDDDDTKASLSRPVQNSATVSKLTSPRGAVAAGNGQPRASQSISGKKWSSAAQSRSSPRAPNDSRIPVLVRSQIPASHSPCGANDSPPTACEMHLSATVGERTNARDRVTSRKTPTITTAPVVIQQVLSVEGANRVVEAGGGGGGGVRGGGSGRMTSQSGEPSEKSLASRIATDKGATVLRPKPSAGKVSTPSSATSSRVTVQNVAESPVKPEDPRKESQLSAKALRQQKAFMIHQNRIRKKYPPCTLPPRTDAVVKPRQTGPRAKINGAPAYLEINSRHRGLTPECHSPVNRSAAARGGVKQQKRRSDRKFNDATVEGNRVEESGAVVPPPHPPPPPLTPLEIPSSYSIDSSLESPVSTHRSQATDRSDGQWNRVPDRLPPPKSMGLGTAAPAAAAAAEGSDLMQRWITSIARVLSPSSNLSDELSDTDALSNPDDIYRQARSLLDSYGGYQALYDSTGSSSKYPATGAAAKDATTTTEASVTCGAPSDPDPASVPRVAVKSAGSCRRPAKGSAATVGRSESLNLWTRNRSIVASPRSVADGGVVVSSSGLSGSVPRKTTHMERCNRPRVVQARGHSTSSPMSAGSSREVTPRKPPRERCKKAPPPPPPPPAAAAETTAKKTAAEEEEEEEEGEERREEAPESSSVPAAASAELIPAKFAVFSIVEVSDDENDEDLPGEIAPWAAGTATERNTNEEEEEEEEEYGVCSVCPISVGVAEAVDNSRRQVTAVSSKCRLSVSSVKEKAVRTASKPGPTAASGPPSVAASAVNSEAAASAATRAEGIAAGRKGNSEICPAAPPPPGKAFADEVCWTVLSDESSRVREPEVDPRKAAVVKIAHLPGTIEQQVITVTEFQDTEIELNHAVRSMGDRETQQKEAAGGGGGWGMRFRIPVLKKIISVIPTWVVNSATVSPSTEEGTGQKKKNKKKNKKKEKKNKNKNKKTESDEGSLPGGGRLAVATEESYSVVDVTFTDLDEKSFASVRQELDQPTRKRDRKRDRKSKSSSKRHRRHHHSSRKSEKHSKPTVTATSSADDPAADFDRRQAAKNTAKALLQLLQSEFLKQSFEKEEEWRKDKAPHKKRHSTDAAKHGGGEQGGHRRRLPVMPSFDELSSASTPPNRTTAAPVQDPLTRTASVDTTRLLLNRRSGRDSSNNSLAPFPLGSSVTQVFSKRRSEAGASAGAGAGHRASKWSTSLYAKTIYFEKNQYNMDIPRQLVENKDANFQETAKNCIEERWLTKEDLTTSFLHSDDDVIRTQ